MPAGLNQIGLPMGLQVMCRMHGELDCLAFGRAYDAASPWSAVRPPMLDEM
jgi:Asp-tRNA(Asn)/Glu-tRNA(Gln) amidotransferase A subunit family amidase